MRKISAKFNGKCSRCPYPVLQGQSVWWQRGANSVYHNDCDMARLAHLEAEGNVKHHAAVAVLESAFLDAPELDISEIIGCDRPKKSHPISCSWLGFTRWIEIIGENLVLFYQVSDKTHPDNKIGKIKKIESNPDLLDSLSRFSINAVTGGR